jgi:ubiquinone/menaquinone biosynthesis C-methylase UbiE
MKDEGGRMKVKGGRQKAEGSNGHAEGARGARFVFHSSSVSLHALILPFAFCLLPSFFSLPADVARGDEPAASAEAAEDAKLPPPLTHYKGREIAVTMHYEGAPWLTRESRQREEDCASLLKALQIKPGQKVCDLGCGNGFYTLRMARKVGKTGTVYAVDIQQEMLHLLSERAKGDKLENIKLVLANRVDPRLPEHELDLVLMVDVYHELSNPEEVLKAVRRSLKPHGRLVLGEFRLEDPNVPIKLLHKMSKEQILKEILPAGFRPVQEFDSLPWQHLMFFEPEEQAKDER